MLVNYEGKIFLVFFLNGDVKYENFNFDEKMWNILWVEVINEYVYFWV